MKSNGFQPKIVGVSCNWCCLSSGAIAIHHSTDEQILAQIEALFG